MSSESEESQSKQAMHAFQEFVRILVKEYPLIFKNESGSLKLKSEQPLFPYEASLEVKKIKES